MKRFLLLLTVFFTCFSLMASTAEAKRFGGGSSFGKQRSVSPQQPRKAAEAAPAPAPAQKSNKWLGPLAGLAIGAALGSMFSGALGGAFGSILLAILAGLVVLFLINRFSKPKPSPMQYAGMSRRLKTMPRPCHRFPAAWLPHRKLAIFRLISLWKVFCATPKRLSSACKLRMIAKISMIFGSTPRLKCTQKSPCK